jgi:hypothetical protein
MKTISLAGIGPAQKSGVGPQTLVVPAQQRGVITNVHGSSVTGGAVTLNLGTVGGTVSLGSIAANGRIDVALEESVAIGDPDFDIVLSAPADFIGSISGYLASGTS